MNILAQRLDFRLKSLHQRRWQHPDERPRDHEGDLQLPCEQNKPWLFDSRVD